MLIGTVFAVPLPIMRRRLFFGAFPAAVLAGHAQAQSRRLRLACYSPRTLGNTAAQLFADKAALSPDALQVVLEVRPPTVPLVVIGKTSPLASYHAPSFSSVEPVLGLCTVPMLAATFDEAETLHRIARPHYAAALARHGQILLATEPWRPAALWSTFRLRSAGDLRGAAFALDETPYVGDGWSELFSRLGTRRASYADAEVMLSSGYTSSVELAQQFACVTEVFFATQLTFLTASQQVFESLPEAQREDLLAIGRATEAELWRDIRELVPRDHRDIAKRGVVVSAAPPADILAALRTAAEPGVRRWAAAMGAEGATLLADYRRVIGF
jgi:TRAP-type C4-dicarboxylate transport system substrate-binding protein